MSTHWWFQWRWPRDWREAVENGLILLRAIYTFKPGEKAYFWGHGGKHAPTVTPHALWIWPARYLLLSANLKEMVVMEIDICVSDGEVFLLPITRRRQGIPRSLRLSGQQELILKLEPHHDSLNAYRVHAELTWRILTHELPELVFSTLLPGMLK